MGQYGMTNYYSEKLQQGLRFQDFISDQLRNHGMFVGTYASRYWQNSRGENMAGIEIKYDRNFAKTGNLYIEIAEKSNPNIQEYTPSGIYRNDNSWAYLIGDYEQAFLFSKRQLQIIYEKEAMYERKGIKRVQIATSKGFLLPVSVARRGPCIREFEFSGGV